MARYLYVGCPQTHKDLLTFGSRVLELRCIPSCLACEFLSKPFFFSFLQGRVNVRFVTECDLVRHKTALWKPSGVRGLPFVQGNMTADSFALTTSRDEPLLSSHVYKSICIKLGEAPLFWDVDLLVARELDLGSIQSLNHVLYSAAWCGWTWWPGQCKPWSLCPGASQRYLH